jgi:hypothetical protein
MNKCLLSILVGRNVRGNKMSVATNIVIQEKHEFPTGEIHSSIPRSCSSFVGLFENPQ